ncbi:MAG TPA: amidohydrolase family protein [Acidimicrobiales bacterium]|nr:amidohydrolase family protein [Acidimicrobiales bacterium]
MLDAVVRNGLVVDGTGAPGRRADVAISGGRVVAVGEVDDQARRVVDATDLVVAPGFIDLHTHYDAQAFWDPTLSPSPLHGVTTTVSGNCGFTIAPLSADPEDADYLMRMLARVEGMPLRSLQEGVPWDWTTTAEFLDRLDGRTSPNTAFLVGHSALRRVVMGGAAVEGPARPEQIEAMKALLRDGLRAGALGFSSTWSRSHNDHLGNPVPSRHATADELIALCQVVSEFPGTTLEFIPAPPPFDDDLFDLMAAMSRAADRPINWNVLPVYSKNREVVERQLLGSDHAADRGGRVVALTLPDSQRNRLNFKSGFILDILPGWETLMARPDDEKLAMLRDPAGRAEMDRLAQTQEGPLRSIANWRQYIVLETFSPENKPYEGLTVGEVAERTGRSAWDALADMVVADGLRTVIMNQDRGQDDETWRRRVDVWRDPRTVVGASDAGAHLDMIDTFNYPTTMLAKPARELGLISMEEVVHHLTGAPAALYGLLDRGCLRAGAHADLVVFDPATVAPEPVSTRFDLPGGAARVYGGAVGIEHVMVAGVDIVTRGEFTDDRPGRVLRSGRDTTTVTASPA